MLCGGGTLKNSGNLIEVISEWHLITMCFKEGCEEEQFLLEELYFLLLCCSHLKSVLMNILHTHDELPLISLYTLYIQFFVVADCLTASS